MRSPQPHLLEELRVKLLNGNSGSVLTQLLVPPVLVALHDHDYDAKNVDAANLTKDDFNVSLEMDDCFLSCLTELSNLTSEEEKLKLNVTPERIEQNTRKQSKSSEWHDIRARRFTGSKCGKIICQQSTTVALLLSVLP